MVVLFDSTQTFSIVHIMQWLLIALATISWAHNQLLGCCDPSLAFMTKAGVETKKFAEAKPNTWWKWNIHPNENEIYLGIKGRPFKDSQITLLFWETFKESWHFWTRFGKSNPNLWYCIAFPNQNCFEKKSIWQVKTQIVKNIFSTI